MGVRVDSHGDNMPEDAWQPLMFNNGASFMISGKTFLIRTLPEQGHIEDEIVVHNFGKRRALNFESGTCATDFLTEATNRLSKK